MRVFSWLWRLVSGRASKERADKRDITPFVERAVHRTGLVKPEYIPAIVAMMAASPDARSEGIGLADRKGGTQLSPEQKAALGLRKNAFFSKEAEAMLTDAGREFPLDALPHTINHVTNALAARRDVNNARAAGCTKYRWRTAGDVGVCKFCRSRSNKLFALPVTFDDLDDFPGSCVGCTDGLCRCYAEPVIPR